MDHPMNPANHLKEMSSLFSSSPGEGLRPVAHTTINKIFEACPPLLPLPEGKEEGSIRPPNASICSLATSNPILVPQERAGVRASVPCNHIFTATITPLSR